MNRNNFLGIGFLIHPVPIFAFIILAFNDHYLKAHYPCALTGKLSDFAGVFVFPIFLCALWSLIQKTWITTRSTLIAIAITDLIFVSVKLIPTAAIIYAKMMSAMGFPSHITLDPTDLIALGSNIFTYWYAWRVSK